MPSQTCLSFRAEKILKTSEYSAYKICINVVDTRPKPVEHSYVFSMAVGSIGEWLKLVPFFVRGRTIDWGGGWQFFKINILAIKHL